MALAPSLRFFRFNLIFSTVVSWLCTVWILTQSSESESAILFGYSFQRLLLAAILGALATFFSLFVIRSWQDNGWLKGFQKRFAQTLSPTAKRFASFVLTTLLVISWVLFFVPTSRAISIAGGIALYLDGLRPLLLCALLLAGAWLGYVAFSERINPVLLKGERPHWQRSLLVFSFFILVVATVGLTGIGLGFDASVWNAPGTPLLASQLVVLVIFVPIVLIAAFVLTRKFNWPEARLDFGLAALVWLLAATIWLSQPAQPTYYETGPMPPNFQIYPLSDAFNHDVIANNVLIGQGFTFGGDVVIRRPLYVMFLAGVEALVGANYEAVIFVQVIVLALFPAIGFFIGLALHNRYSGLLLGGLIIFREANSILLGHIINASHAKMLMADLPTALMIAAVTYAVIRWLQKGRASISTPLLVGGLIGAAVLLRSQVLTIIPFLLIPAVLTFGFAKFWRPAAFLLLGVLLVTGPWIMRNRIQSGQWVIEDAVVAGFLANRYRFDPGTFGLPFLAGETEGEFYARQMASVRDFAIQNPLYVAGFVADNYVRNQSLNLLSLPVSWQLRDLESHVRELPYWPGWEGDIPLESYLPLGAGLLLVSIGLVTAWRKWRWIGLVPLFVLLGFVFSLAVARVSGWRYNLPVDWIVLLYFAFGIGQVVTWVLLGVSKDKRAKTFLSKLSPAYTRIGKQKPENLRRVVLTAFPLIVLGLSFFIVESISRPRYTEVGTEQLTQILSGAQLGTGASIEEQRLLVKLSDISALEASAGRALHPRFYPAGEGLERGFSLVDTMDFDRLTFYLIGPEPGSVIFPASKGIEVPASADVVVVRCAGLPVALVLNSKQSSTLFVSDELDRVCPSN